MVEVMDSLEAEVMERCKGIGKHVVVMVKIQGLFRFSL